MYTLKGLSTSLAFPRDRQLLEHYQLFLNNMVFSVQSHLLEGTLVIEKFKGAESIKILSLGCGVAPELIPLIVLFKKHGITVEYTGIDLEEPLRILNHQLYKDEVFNAPKFFAADASTPGNLKDFLKDTKYDLIILNHPYLLDLEPDLKKNFISMIQDTVPYYLKTNGTVYASFHYEEEYNVFMEIAEKLSFFSEDHNLKIKPVGGIKYIRGKEEIISDQFIYVSGISAELKATLMHSDRPAHAKGNRKAQVETPLSCKGIFGIVATYSVAVAAGLAMNYLLTHSSENSPSP